MMKRATILFVFLFSLLVLVLPAAAAPGFPEIIPLPTGDYPFRPEGIALGPGPTFYAGSLGDFNDPANGIGGAIVKGDLRTGTWTELVPGAQGYFAVGMDYDPRSDALFVASGLNGAGRVYDATSGALLEEYELVAPFAGFINDVIVTRDAAYFTNSFAPFFYRVPLGPGGTLPDAGAVETIALGGDWIQEIDFNANGIVATADGSKLIIVNSATQALYVVDPDTGIAEQIDLGSPLPNGDGLVLQGRTLYVVQNASNQIGVITLSPDLSTGTIGTPITNANFDVPTTAALFGSSLYAVNAKFGTDPAGTPYEIVKVSRR
ncbi:MAG: superoxide dismutase [Candidatus Promineifilaceae bacterium]